MACYSAPARSLAGAQPCCYLRSPASLLTGGRSWCFSGSALAQQAIAAGFWSPVRARRYLLWPASLSSGSRCCYHCGPIHLGGAPALAGARRCWHLSQPSSLRAVAAGATCRGSPRSTTLAAGDTCQGPPRSLPMRAGATCRDPPRSTTLAAGGTNRGPPQHPLLVNTAPRSSGVSGARLWCYVRPNVPGGSWPLPCYSRKVFTRRCLVLLVVRRLAEVPVVARLAASNWSERCHGGRVAGHS